MTCDGVVWTEGVELDRVTSEWGTGFCELEKRVWV